MTCWRASCSDIKQMVFLPPTLIASVYGMNFHHTQKLGRFWVPPWPAPILLWATLGTEVVATAIAAEGWIITAIGWPYALMIWSYALAWFVINDVMKMAAYRLVPQRSNGVSKTGSSSALEGVKPNVHESLYSD